MRALLCGSRFAPGLCGGHGPLAPASRSCIAATKAAANQRAANPPAQRGVPYMTCQEVRDFLCDGLQTEGETSRSLALAQHLTACTECSRLWATREELRTGLATVRESAPALPASLDRAVLANFRQCAARSLVSVKRPARAWPVFRWTAAAALLVLAFGIKGFFSAREH